MKAEWGGSQQASDKNEFWDIVMIYINMSMGANHLVRTLNLLGHETNL